MRNVFARSGLRKIVPAAGRLPFTYQLAIESGSTCVQHFDGSPGVEVATTLEEALSGADAVMALRVQLERGAGLPEDHTTHWRLDEERMALAMPGAPILHPGPTNEGVEITADLANGPRSLIGRQVENGVPVRMAVLATLAGVA